MVWEGDIMHAIGSGLFSIFFCGCKLPKSFHIFISSAKVGI